MNNQDWLRMYQQIIGSKSFNPGTIGERVLGLYNHALQGNSLDNFKGFNFYFPVSIPNFGQVAIYGTDRCGNDRYLGLFIHQAVSDKDFLHVGYFLSKDQLIFARPRLITRCFESDDLRSNISDVLSDLSSDDEVDKTVSIIHDSIAAIESFLPDARVCGDLLFYTGIVYEVVNTIDYESELRASTDLTNDDKEQLLDLGLILLELTN